MKERIQEIENQLTAFKKKKYLKKDLLSELFALQKEIVDVTFNSDHAEKSSLKLWDVERHLSNMNEDCGHIADDLLESFSKQSKDFSEMIKGIFSGAKGESKAYKSLETISCNHRLLRNIELKFKNHRTEVDIIAITENTVFLIEVKNTSKNVVIDEKGNYCRVTYSGDLVFDKNIGEQMNEKEYLLREVLKNAGLENVQIKSLVVFTDSNANVINNYAYIKECYLSQLPHIIDGVTSEYVLSNKQMAKIAQAILEARCEEAYPVEMDMSVFKTTFATLLATLEKEKAKQKEIEEIRTKKISFLAWFRRRSKSACFYL